MAIGAQRVAGETGSEIMSLAKADPIAAARDFASQSPVLDFMSMPGIDVVSDAVDYWIDSAQRWFLFWDTLRKQANFYTQPDLDETVETGEAEPVIGHTCEPVVDGRQFEDSPVNLALVRILPQEGQLLDSSKRPIVIADPRAAYAEGMPGSEDRRVRLALAAGHFTYLIVPVTGDGRAGAPPAAMDMAERRFLNEVAQRHPEADGGPCLIGRCRDSEAIAVLAAERPDVAGTTVIEGKPLSYLCGDDGANPWQFAGSLAGGGWWPAFLSDLGLGQFDAAHSAASRVWADPASNLLEPAYGLYATIDTTDESYLAQSRWRHAVFRLSERKRHLLTTTAPPHGTPVLEDGTPLVLAELTEPIVIDARTEQGAALPASAVGWIRAACGSVTGLKRARHTVVYCINKNHGHLGVAVVPPGKPDGAGRRQGMGGSVFGPLRPGLYEIVLAQTKHDDAAATPFEEDCRVEFLERRFEDLEAGVPRSLHDPVMDKTIHKASRNWNWLYRMFARPWIEICTTPTKAAVLRDLHPLRLAIGFLSDRNPWMLAVRTMAGAVREDRHKAARDNYFVEHEQSFMASALRAIHSACSLRDQIGQGLNRLVFGNALVRKGLGA